MHRAGSHAAAFERSGEAVKLVTPPFGQAPLQLEAKRRRTEATDCPPIYRIEHALGRGSFGTVYHALELRSGRSVAIKSIRGGPPGEAERELRILKLVSGAPNVVTLLGFFISGENETRAANIVLEYLPDTLQRIIKHTRNAWNCCMDIYHVCLYMYQLLRGLASLARMGVVHRDVKPANLLVHPRTHALKVCDFGSATVAGSNEPHTPYVCSRYYRAPELILSASGYTNAVDVWSAGCVLAEMLIGRPLFAGRDGVDQLGQILEVLGTPSPAELHAMNPSYDAEVCFEPRVRPLPMEVVLGLGQGSVTPEAAELAAALLRFDPSARPQPMPALAAAFFDLMRRESAGSPPGAALPGLIALAPAEITGCPVTMRDRLLAGGCIVELPGGRGGSL